MSANAITILRPYKPEKQARKIILADGTIKGAADIAFFRHETLMPEGIEDLHKIVSRLAKENAMVVRGHPASARQPIHRQHAFFKDHGDNGFEDVPKAWGAFDLDGIKLPPPAYWWEDVEAAVDHAVGLLPECFWDCSYSWAFSASHGLEKDGKQWNGNYVGDELRLRLWFWFSRPVAEAVLRAWMRSMGDMAPVDTSVAGRVQPIYVSRPVCADGTDPLARLGVPLSGFRQGLEAEVIVPDDLEERTRWARAEGHGGSCASHPSAEAAVAAIGKPAHPNGRAEIRSHMKSAALHLARNERDAGREPKPADMHARILEEIEKHRDEIGRNLEQANPQRHWVEVDAYAGDDLMRLCEWMAEWVESDNMKAQDGGGKRKIVRRVDHAPAPAEGLVFVDRDEARAAAKKAAQAYVRAVMDHTAAPRDQWNRPPLGPQHLLALPTGGGKTHAEAEVVVAELLPVGPVVLLKQNIALADEVADRVRQAVPGALVVVRRGMEQPDPDQPGKLMCHRPDDVQTVLEHGLPVSSTLCEAEVKTKDDDGAKKGKKEKKEKTCVLCPSHGACGYIRQRAALALADVTLMAHAHLASGVPVDVRKPVAVVVDESPMGNATGGTDAPYGVGLGVLLSPGVLVDGDLARWRKEIGRAVADEPDGPVRGELLAQWSGIAGKARGEEWALVREVPYPVTGLTGAVLRERLAAITGGAYGINRVKRMAAFWRAVEDAESLPHGARSGRLWLWTDPKTGQREARMAWKLELAEGWDRVPILITDATADPQVLRQVFTRLEDAPRYTFRNPHVTVRQIVDRSLSHYTIVGPDEVFDPDGTKRRTARNNAAKVFARLVADALERYGGQDVLAVVPQAVELQWREIGLPSWLHLMHHGATVGVDHYRNVRAVYIVGRPLPRAQAVERVAGALTGVAVEATDYLTVESIIATAEGKGVATRAMQHPDALCEALRRQTTETAIIQAAGRIRAINRTADSPADIVLWTDIAVPELGPVVAELWQGPTVDEVMLSRGGWFERAGDAVTAWPDLGTRQAVEDARGRAERKFCYMEPNKQILHSGLTAVRYRRSVPRSGTAEAVILGEDPESARRFLEARLGPLALFEVIQPTDGADTRRPAPESEAVAPVQPVAQPVEHHAPAPEPPPDPPPKPLPRPVAALPGLGGTVDLPRRDPFSGARGLRTVALGAASATVPVPGHQTPPRSPPKPWLAAATGHR